MRQVKKAYYININGYIRSLLSAAITIVLSVLLGACSGGSSETSQGSNAPGNSGGVHTTSGFIQLGQQQSASGQILTTMQNTPFSLSSNQLVSGSYGSLTINASGLWLYTLNANAADLISRGSSVEERLEIYENGSLLQAITIVINSVTVTERSVVFIAVNFNDDLVSDEINEFEIDNMFFHDTDSVNNLYQANSLGQLRFIRDRNNDNLLDYYTSYINFNVADGDCAGIPDGQDWADAADDYLRTQLNVQPNAWDHRVYLFPGATGPACEYAGQAPIDCSAGFCWAYIVAHTKTIIAHELGHNFGFGHAATDRNNDGDFEDANEDEYGDGGDIMGSFTGSRTIGPAHRDHIHWYDDYRDFTATLNTSGSVAIQTHQHTASELPNNALPQLLKVFNPNPGPNQANWYYVSYHEEHEINNTFPFHDRRVKVHYLSDSFAAPATSMRVAVLRVGQSFTDDYSDISIRVDSINTGTASISVTYD